MNSREQTLAFVLLILILMTAAGAIGYFFILEPIEKANTAETALNAEVADLEQQFEAQKRTAQRLGVARVRSLPPDKEMAAREYAIALHHLMDTSGISNDSELNRKTVNDSARNVPEIAKGKPIYTRIVYELIFKKADMWMVKDFLQSYYQLGLLHQITSFSIKKEEETGAKNGTGRRNNLTVTLTTEAIIIDNAEPRKTLLSVPTAFAAIGGGAMYKALTVSPEAARGIRPQQLVPMLSPVGRDYNLLVLKDPFNGPLPPPPPPPSPSPFKLQPIRDVKIKSGEKPSPVRVTMTGEGSNGATFTALAAGSLFAEGELKVDGKNFAIDLPATDASEGTATITIMATAADGKTTDKTTFKVSLEEKIVEVKDPGEDISPYVVLIGTTPRSDGTAWARIKDNANRLRYEIEAKPNGVTVIKEWFVTTWRPDRDYDEAPGVLHITAEKAKTNRTFKVIAIDSEGLIVADLKPEGSTPVQAAPPQKGKGGGRFGAPPPPAKQGQGNPLAALGGNRIIAVPKPKLYRWEVGQPLSKLEEIPDEDAKKILKIAGESGPVFDVASGR